MIKMGVWIEEGGYSNSGTMELVARGPLPGFKFIILE